MGVHLRTTPSTPPLTCTLSPARRRFVGAVFSYANAISDCYMMFVYANHPDTLIFAHMMLAAIVLALVFTLVMV